MLIGGIFINVVRVKYEGSGGVAPRKMLDICAEMSKNL